MTYKIFIPTLNAKFELSRWIESYDPALFFIIDSSSSDGTIEYLKKIGIGNYIIPRNEFNHGATRNIARKIIDVDIYIFLTQDVIPLPDAFDKLIKAFNNNHVGMAYGRQIAPNRIGPFGAHARYFNYPETSQLRSFEDRNIYGVKTVFCSNSFAGYRKRTLEQVGWFPEDVIQNEDTYVAAKALMQGWKIAYVHDAIVYHGHNYTVLQEFKRYFDIGVFHGNEKWIIKTFGKTEGEGKRFVLSEWNYLTKHGYAYLLPISIIRNIAKFIAFKLGVHEKFLPIWLKKMITMNNNYWLIQKKDKKGRNK
jgi:rhamnosyltransferase